MTRAVVVLFAGIVALTPVPLQVSVSVADSRGRAVAGLTPDDFVVKVGDVDAGVTSVEIDPRPLSIVVIADGYESVDVLDARSALTEILKAVRTMADGARVGLILGDEGASVPSLDDAVTAAADHNRRVSRFFQSSTAPPVDTLMAAATALSAPKEENRRHVVLTLSVNRRGGGQQFFGDIITALRRADVTMASVETGQGSDQSLYLIHESLGGEYVRVSDASALGLVGTRLAKTLTSAYVVRLDGPDGNLRLSVGLTNPRGRTVIAPARAR